MINANNIIIHIYNNNKLPNNIHFNKNEISNLDYTIFPLYDINTNNIYLVDKENIYSRIVNENYRFPDLFILEYLKLKIGLYTEEISKIEKDEDNYLVLLKLSNIKKSVEFLNFFNLDILKEKFIKVFNEYGESKYKEFTTCIRPSYTNILPNTYYIKPYFSFDELKKNSIIYEDNNIKDDDLCFKSIMRDLHYSKLIRHQKHIIENNGAGILQYYSLVGSYLINNYLRELYPNSKYNNEVLNQITKAFWNIIISAPSFEEDFYIYRFINDDSFLSEIKVGDIFQDKGFLSCTRDPYYTSQYYNFGSILMKIKVPKNKIGVGLCLELFSHFGREQEILLAPNTPLKLVKVDDNVKYEHTNMDINMKLKRKYEFHIIDTSKDIKLPIKIEVNVKTTDNIININNENNLFVLFDNLKDNYLNENNQLKFKIGNDNKLLTIDKIKISEAYTTKVYYAGKDDNTPTEEVVIYYFDKNEIIFFIEIVKESDKNEIFVNLNNYYNYNNQRIEDNFDMNDFFIFLKKIGKYFMCDEIVLSCDFISCEYFKNPTKLNKIIDDYKDILGGNFNLEIYNYFKYNKIRFSEYIKKDIIVPLFDIQQLKKYNTLEMKNLINLTDSIELKQIYESYESYLNKKISVKDFFIYIKENKCFLISELSYIISLYEVNNNLSDDELNLNIFYNPFYILDITKVN